MRLYEIIVKIDDKRENRQIELLRTKKKSLQECADELDITYQQAADISSQRWRQKSKYRFTPDIEINKINKVILIDNISTDTNEERNSSKLEVAS